MSGVTQPDWVIIGARQEGHHFVYASRELDRVELEMVYDDDDPWGYWRRDPFALPRLRYIELRGRLRSYVVVQGESYADCLARLAAFGEPGQWQDPDAQPTTELPSPRLELGAGPPALTPGEEAP